MQPRILLNAFSIKPKMHLEHIHLRYPKPERFLWHGGNVKILSRGGNFQAILADMVLRLLTQQPTALKAVNNIIFKWEEANSSEIS